MNRKHVSKVGKYIGMACLLFVCAMVQSCRDEYYFDDREPDFLGASIYDYLEEQGNFKNFLQVIKDLEYDLVLKKTGSKTLFVADDVAFMKGIDEAWGIKDTAQLTLAHKRIILNGAMLDNAYLLEMLSKQPSTGANSEPTPGLSLRRKTSATVTDTIPLFHWDNLPENNKDWDIFRTEKRKVRLALDATSTMLTHFTADQAYMSGITEDDLRLILGNNEAKLTDYYIFDKKVIKGDVTCKNGYVHQLDGLLIPPANMAEELRQNGEGVTNEDLAKGETTTFLFSRMLDRFAAPAIAPSEVTEEYNRIYHLDDDEAAEVVYEKRYYTEGSNRGASGDYLSYKDGQKSSGSLLFDPGWNAYQAGTSGQTSNEQDMAAIFAPTDKALYTYFTEKDAGGSTVLGEFAKEGDPLVKQIDSIPLDIIQALVRNHMQISFNSTVPSKFELILNDARDPMEIKKENVVKCMVANNGVVYVVDTVYSPARYVAVTAPVMLKDSLAFFNGVINTMGYDKYLLSMGNNFGLIVASNNSMVFYDPKTELEDKRKAYKFTYAEPAGKPEYNVERWEYNHEEGEYGPLVTKKSTTTMDMEKLKKKELAEFSLLKDILEYNILLGDLKSAGENLSGTKVYPKYYMSKGYGSIKVERDANGDITHIAGGRELQYGKKVSVAKDSEQKPLVYSQKNGLTIQLEGMVHPATQSVYKVLKKEDSFAVFAGLCETAPSADLLKYVGVSTANERDMYKIFKEDGLDKNVRMFNTYHYTVYVPSADAMEDAIQKGLPTWVELEAKYKQLSGWEADSLVKLQTKYKESMSEDDSLEWIAFKENLQKDKIALKKNVDLLHHFIKYHFQDNSVYVDNVKHQLVVEGKDPETAVTYETAALNEETKRFCPVLVKTATKGGRETLSVRGDFSEKQKGEPNYNTCYVINNPEDENRLYNVMARDIEFKGDYIYTSSFSVVHQIDGFLANDVIFDPAAESGSGRFKTEEYVIVTEEKQ